MIVQIINISTGIKFHGTLATHTKCIESFFKKIVQCNIFIYKDMIFVL